MLLKYLMYYWQLITNCWWRATAALVQFTWYFLINYLSITISVSLPCYPSGESGIQLVLELLDAVKQCGCDKWKSCERNRGSKSFSPTIRRLHMRYNCVHVNTKLRSLCNLRSPAAFYLQSRNGIGHWKLLAVYANVHTETGRIKPLGDAYMPRTLLGLVRYRNDLLVIHYETTCHNFYDYWF